MMTGTKHEDREERLDEGAIRTALLERRETLLRLSQTAAEGRATVELDQTRVGRLSRMDALQGQAMSKATEERRQMELRRIEAALDRLDAGNYGYCLRCEEPISVERLQADPTTPICIDCAQSRDR